MEYLEVLFNSRKKITSDQQDERESRKEKTGFYN